MSCHNYWSHEQLVSMLPKTWIAGEYKRHREAVLLDRQKAQLASTQQFVDVERHRRASLARIHELQSTRATLRARLAEVNEAIGTEWANMHRRAPAERREFVMRCVRTNCRGFLSEAYRCNACDARVCPRCFVIKTDEEHD